MKLKTIPAFFNRSIKINDNKEIKFDHTGTLEVDNKTGAELLEKYPEFIFSENKTEKSQDQKLVQEVSQELVNGLNSEIYDLKQVIAELKEAKAGAEADIQIWKDKVGESEAKAKSAEEALQNEKDSVKKRVQELELKIELLGSTRDQLVALCESSKFAKEEYEKLNKEKLIDYVLSKG